ncbi:putative Histidine kinase [Nitrospina gracilis 3/211]|uniref:histidine kinase n=1 Tax=Nitrospina gracilis (strain 3/211) TaxID=1266370 RepID=M1Z8H9_NITG3|nr:MULTISPECIES: ATP-binding protein [Nitrospina]MCF8722143.1 signal transduction histidine kinase [Nitrospina sp. Nb-3]CCQ89334.1 putative Histidine kinase [Nitrospina gracilis 3/211]
MSSDIQPQNPSFQIPAVKLELLKQTRVFGLLDTANLEKLLSEGREWHLKEEDMLLKEGDTSKSLFVILSGEIEVTRGGKLITRLQSGDLLGEMALIDFKPRSANAHASQESLLLEVEEELFRQTVGSNPQALWEMLQILSTHIRGLLGSLEQDILSLRHFTHDLKNCLTPLGYAEFWAYELLGNLRGTDQEHRPRQGWDTAQKCHDTISSVKSDLLTMVEQGLSRIKSKSVEHTKSDYDLTKLLHDTVEEISLHKHLKGKKVVFQNNGTEHFARFNYLDIKRVIQNLLINAGYATEPEGEIHIHLKYNGDRVQVGIQDFGDGISSEVQNVLFKDVYTSKPDGNGFGLLSCREIIEDLHRGRIWFETEQGMGSTFLFEIERDPVY